MLSRYVCYGLEATQSPQAEGSKEAEVKIREKDGNEDGGEDYD